MSDLNSLVEKIKADENLKKQFAQAVKEGKIEEFCKGLEFDTTKEEIASFLKAKKELSDSELNNVSGGCDVLDVCFHVLSVGTAGYFCEAYSIMEGVISTCGNDFV